MDAMVEEYELVADTGMILRIDALELLTIGQTAAFADESLEEIRAATRLYVEALNEGLENVPAEGLAPHLLGELRGFPPP